MGCDIFGILLKMEKVILVISTLVLPPLPPPPADPVGGRERQAPWGGGGLEQGLLWL